MTGLVVSYKTFAKYEDHNIFYFFPEETTEIIALPLLPDKYAPDHLGYVIIENKYIKTIKLASG